MQRDAQCFTWHIARETLRGNAHRPSQVGLGDINHRACWRIIYQGVSTMSTTLTAANDQWMNRPADQRFSSLQDLHNAVTHHRTVAVEAQNVSIRTLSIEPRERIGESGIRHLEPVLISATGQSARFTHYSFGQLSRRLGAPAGYLRTLPADLAADNLNHGITHYDEARDPDCDETAREGDTMLFAQNGDMTLRALTSSTYTRIWNADVTARLVTLTEQAPEWQPAPAAFDGSRGLYASDKDMFAFLVDNDRRIFEKGPGGGLGRGFFVSNSEVGDASFRITTFYYEYVCGNHRVWGAQGVKEIRIPHVGKADAKAFGKLRVELRKYADSAAAEDELKVEKMRTMTLGNTKDEVLDALFNLGVSKRLGGKVITLAEQEEAKYGNPVSVWGLTGAMTQIARDLPNADERVKMDRLAGKVMQIAF